MEEDLPSGGLCKLSREYHKRKKFAMDLVKILKEGKILINYDESVFGGTTS
jgi:hypothetical protein